MIRLELPFSLSFDAPLCNDSFLDSFEFSLASFFFLDFFLVGVELLLLRLGFLGGFTILLT